MFEALTREMLQPVDLAIVINVTEGYTTVLYSSSRVVFLPMIMR